MTSKKAKPTLKKWIFILGGFILLQVLFMLIDKTFLEPPLNKMGELITTQVEPKLEWFTLYTNTYFKIITLLFIISIIIAAIKDGFIINKGRR